MTTAHAVKTGMIQIRPSHRAGNMNLPLWRRRLAILLDREWTEPLPIYTFLIEHDEGLIQSTLARALVPRRAATSLGGARSSSSRSTFTSSLRTRSDPGCARWASTRAKTSGWLC
jgi:hypothetical protein